MRRCLQQSIDRARADGDVGVRNGQPLARGVAGHEVHGSTEAQVLLGGHERGPGEALAHHLGRAIRRCVVYDPDLRKPAIYFRLERAQATVEQIARVP
jgi:hypothetical protein